MFININSKGISINQNRIKIRIINNIYFKCILYKCLNYKDLIKEIIRNKKSQFIIVKLFKVIQYLIKIIFAIKKVNKFAY